ncbi:MAG: flagellar hook protein FlgE [Firmicutes bacterium]|nr:flagellar hook protein FlgE [Bacillota bacterium]
MMRSLYAGVTGLRNHQTRLDVIGSNIANVNTVGYKKSRVTFRDALYQNLRGASSPQGNRGGTNPQQIGLGMNLSTVDVIHDGSSSQSTGKTTDLCIQQGGYFIVNDGGRNFFTRAGNFDFDQTGNFVNLANGYQVMGYLANANGVINYDNLVPLSKANYSTVPPRATTSAVINGNFDAEIPITAPGNTKTVTKSVFDSLGYEHTLNVTYTHTAVNAWTVSYALDGTAGAATANITFDPDGTLAAASPTTLAVSSAITTGATTPLALTVDFADITQYESETTAAIASQDGYEPGDMRSFTIDVTGTIMGSYSNGISQNIGQVATATFQNPAGLLQVGENMFQFSNNSGDPQIGAPGTGSRGTIIPGSLEMSNVDLSSEFTDMIVTQRGFQANSRIITTSDEMLQELVNLKR